MPILSTGEEYARDIKRRAKAQGKTVTRVFYEAEVNYRNYKAWRSEGVDPSLPNLKKVYQALDAGRAHK
ncbi:MAG: hypothetical protein K8U57_27680 [Planctomycetes bacterium]|nr:hypothetical protein [Planctomycetota bacterium]